MEALSFAGGAYGDERINEEQCCRIDERMSFRTDHRRVFNALTIPEYLEAWMVLPGGESLVCPEVIGGMGVLKLVPVSRAAVYISLEPLEVQPDHIRYRWQMANEQGTFVTILDVQLEHSEQHCDLRLSQSGFRSRGEQAWHDALWKQSLRRLYRLLEPSHQVGTVQTSC